MNKHWLEYSKKSQSAIVIFFFFVNAFHRGSKFQNGEVNTKALKLTRFVVMLLNLTFALNDPN